MIIRGGAAFFRAAVLFLRESWAAILVVLTLEIAIAKMPNLAAGLGSNVFAAGVVAMLATVVGVFLVFRFNEAYNRWWEARILWGRLVNASRGFGRQVTTLLTRERLPELGTPEDERQLQRELLYRHIAYIKALRLSLRRQDSWREIEPFLDREEFDSLLRVANIPAQLIQRQGARLASLLKGSTSQHLLLVQFDNTLNELYDIQGSCERIKNTAFPDNVSLSSRVLVWGTMLSIPLGFLEQGEPAYWFEFIVVLFISLSFLLVHQRGEELKNPFDNKPNDTPMTVLCRAIEIDLREQFGESEVPAPIQPANGVLM